MKDGNLYDTLQVSQKASQAEVKQAYRRLVKVFHPDTNLESSRCDRIIQINAAYEILGDPQQRQSYDRRQRQGNTPFPTGDRQQRTASAQNQYRQYRQNTPDRDAHLKQWLTQVYQPVNKMLSSILHSLEAQIDELAADPFDDELMANFQDYLQTCRDFLTKAEGSFRSIPNPATVASVAANLYYCLDRLGDGIDELEFFTLNYDEHYLHIGQELFRIAAGLREEAQDGIRNIFR